jgi:hypothetical protein
MPAFSFYSKMHEVTDTVVLPLAEGERVLWAGAPKTGVVFRPLDFFLVPFSMVWCGFALFWEYLAITQTDALLFKLFGIPFVWVGVQMLVGRFFTDAARRKATRYTITNAAVYIQNLDGAGALVLVPATDLTALQLTKHRDGTGSIRLTNKPPEEKTNATGLAERFSFNTVDGLYLEYISDAGTVLSLLQNLRAR